jgi:N-acetyl-anhydromuramyl-L-alanine amidase AmpD
MPIQPKGIIVHSMSEFLVWEGKTLYAKDFLKKLKLSVHGFIKPDGTYDKMVETPSKAFHAGKSLHEGLSSLNSHFLGVELLVPGVNDYASFSKKINTPGTYSQAQFDQTVKVFKFWMNKYNIPVNNVVRHSDCSGDHVRGKNKGKTDPGSALDWDAFKSALS